MRIAHVCATFPPYWGGTGNVAYYNTLELARRGHDVHLFTPKTAGSETDEHIDGVNVHRLRPIFHFGNAYLLSGLAFLQGYDILHLHFPFFGGEFTALSAYRQHIPLVITYHQDVHLQGVLQVIEKLLRITVSKWVLNQSTLVLFTSLDYGNSSYSLPLIREREYRIGELPNGVDPVHFCPGSVDSSLSQRYKPSPDDFIILLVARLDRAHFFKGVPVLLQALVHLPPSVKAIIVGEGDLKDDYESLARSLKLRDRVFFTGQVPVEALPQYYRLADVTVLPSTTMGEAFGLVLLESMACGTPVIASNLPGVRTVVEMGVDGILVAPGDVDDLQIKLQQLLSTPGEQRLAMGAAGRRKVEQNYTWQLAGERLEKIYCQVIGMNGKSNH